MVKIANPCARVLCSERVWWLNYALVIGVLFARVPLYAQSSNRSFIIEEIQTIERTLKDAKTSSKERRELLIQQAKLFQLTGDLEKAAQAWNDAAFTESGKRDDAALIEGAFCFLAIGELEKVDASIRMVLLTGKESDVLLKTRYLGALLEAFRSGETTALIQLTSDADYEPYKAAIYYTLWKISGADMYKTKLVSEYPLSPETRIVKELNSSKSLVKASPTAMWLLFPGRSALLEVSAARNTVPGSGNKEPIVVLQTGLFSKEENAQEQADRLKSAGFEGIIKEREVKGTKYWAVNVVPGSDINRTILQLHEKGFDSFPVF